MSKTADASLILFKEKSRSLILSTLTKEGAPNASYSPFVIDKSQDFFIFVSSLANHTQDLIDNPVASIMLIEDEKESRQIFARQRATFQCNVDIILNEDIAYNEILDLMEKKHGNIIQLLRGLSDFILFRLKPFRGQYVMGFGKAYKISGDNFSQLEHIDLSSNA